jgi:hypothetical protein
MNNNAPIREPAGSIWSPAWAAWFQQIFDCLPWKRSYNYTFPLDFPSAPAQSQSSLQVTAIGARAGSAVLVTPSIDVPGVYFSGVVTANDIVTLYAKNFTGSAIDPSAQPFRIIILQN